MVVAASCSSQGFAVERFCDAKAAVSKEFGQDAKPLIPAKEAALLLQLAGNQHIILAILQCY